MGLFQDGHFDMSEQEAYDEACLSEGCILCYIQFFFNVTLNVTSLHLQEQMNNVAMDSRS